MATGAPIMPGTRVQIVQRVFASDERARDLPSDTTGLPYEARVRGLLLAPACIGEPCRVETAAGRELEGSLEVVEPADTHTFGRPVAALIEARAIIDRLVRELR